MAQHPVYAAELQRWVWRVADVLLYAYQEETAVAPSQAVAVSEAHLRDFHRVQKVVFRMAVLAVQEAMLAVVQADL